MLSWRGSIYIASLVDVLGRPCDLVVVGVEVQLSSPLLQ